MKSNSRVYVIGHKNPDTDSICSAIAYADIKNRTDKTKTYVARRAGQINEETEYVLKRFGVRAPGYLPNAGTQVKEIEIHEVPSVPGTISVKKAYSMMKNNNVVTLPITSPDNDLQGVITVSDIAESYMDSYDSHVMSLARTQYRSIADTLDGSVIVGNEHGYFIRGKVVVGAFHPDTMENYIEKDDLVILGNRAEDQLCAIEMDASCIIVGLGAKVTKTIQKFAEEKCCVIISSPHDTYTIARLINQSIPVKYLMRRSNLITFNTEDFLDDIKEVMKNQRHRDFPILNKKGKYVGTISRRNLIGNAGKKLILVDHNEESQAVDNVKEAEILEIIDHHRLGSLETMAPVMFRNEPVGCTGTIMYEIYKEKELEIAPNIAGLLCAAIISDTLMFRSPTCTFLDKAAAEALADIAGISIPEFASEMFRAGSNLKDKSPEEIFYQDFKKFSVGKALIGVGQITSLNDIELETLKEKMLGYMEKAKESNSLDMAFFMLTNILKESTDLICYGQGAVQLAAKAFHLDIEEATEKPEPVLSLPGVVSRKKQLIPELMLAEQD